MAASVTIGSATGEVPQHVRGFTEAQENLYNQVLVTVEAVQNHTDPLALFSLVDVETGTGDDTQAILDAFTSATNLGRQGILIAGELTLDAGNRSDDGYLIEVPLGMYIMGAPGNRINVINVTEGDDDYGVEAFRTAQATLGTLTPITVFSGLNFYGENGTDEDTFAPVYQNANSFIGTNTVSTYNVLVEKCSFQFGFGFSVHDRNDLNQNVSTRENYYHCMANGNNTNASYSFHINERFDISEGYECSGGHVLIQGNILTNVLNGSGITIGGNQSGLWFEGCQVIGNTLDVGDDIAITVTDGIRGAIIANNKASRFDVGALVFHGAVSPPELCIVNGNIFSSNCKNPGANLTGIDVRDSTVGGHLIVNNRCFDAGIEGYGQQFALSLSVPNCFVLSNYWAALPGEDGIDVQYSPLATGTREFGNTYANNTHQWQSTAERVPDSYKTTNLTDVIFYTCVNGLSTLPTRAAWSLRADGMIEAGDNLNPKDVNLYRYAADVWKTDDKLIAAAGLGVGNSQSGSTPGTVVKKIQVFDASGNSLGYIAVYDAIT